MVLSSHLEKKGCIQLNKDDEWETPNEILEKAVKEFGINPTLDVCATNQNHKFLKFFAKEDDGLSKDWKEDFFMNPPTSQVSRWIKRAYNEHKKWNVTGLALVFSKTDTRWWHDYIENKAEIHFIKGRLKFLKNGSNPLNSAPYPSCWIIWRRK